MFAFWADSVVRFEWDGKSVVSVGESVELKSINANWRAGFGRSDERENLFNRVCLVGGHVLVRDL